MIYGANIRISSIELWIANELNRYIQNSDR